MAVGNQVDDLPPAALAPAQQLARRVDGVIDVLGLAAAQLEDGVEPADSHLVGFAEASGNRSQTGQDLLGGLLLQPIVEQYDCRQGKWVEREDSNLLLDAVLEQAELLLADVRHQPALPVLHRDRHHHHLDGRPDACARVFLLWQGEAGRSEPGCEPQRQDFSWTNHAWHVSIFPAAAGRLPRTSLHTVLAS